MHDLLPVSLLRYKHCVGWAGTSVTRLRHPPSDHSIHAYPHVYRYIINKHKHIHWFFKQLSNLLFNSFKYKDDNGVNLQQGKWILTQQTHSFSRTNNLKLKTYQNRNYHHSNTHIYTKRMKWNTKTVHEDCTNSCRM